MYDPGAFRAAGSVASRREDKLAPVALKAYTRIADAWSLSSGEASALADMSESMWERVRNSEFDSKLTEDQILRLSALIGVYVSLEILFSEAVARTWFTRPNNGPLFGGSRPVDAAIELGLLRILDIRAYLDALRRGS